jgi:hypothetical protein
MLVRYRNEIRAHIKRAEVDPNLFIPEEPRSDITVVRLTHVPLRFDFLQSPDSFDDFRIRRSLFAPGFPFDRPTSRPSLFLRRLWRLEQADPKPPLRGDESIDDSFWLPVGFWFEFDRAIGYFDHWLLKEAERAIGELSTSDLWLSAEADDFTGTPPAGSETRFSDAEQERVRVAIEQFRLALLDQYRPTPTQLSEINARLEYLSDAVARLNIFDWKALAASTLVGIALNLSLDSNNGRELWRLFLRAFASVSHLLSN